MSDEKGRRVVARNRKARHEYEILDTYEAGLVLKGPEVKSVRDGKVGFQDAFGRIENGEAWLYSLYVAPYEPASRENQDPNRTRKLLLRRREIEELAGAVEEKGLTLVPLELYFRNGWAKIQLALARGKKLYDKREKLKRKVQEKEAQRAMREHGG